MTTAPTAVLVDVGADPGTVRCMPRLAPAVLLVLAGLFAAGCASGEASSTEGATTLAAAPITGVTTTAVPVTAATTVPATEAPTTEAPTTVAPTTEPPPSTLPGEIERREVGTSALGTPITAIHKGTAGGRVVLVIGVIHGDEPAGAQIVEQLEQLPVPDGVDLWLVPSMNPDGQAAVDRHNANGVDLNRNFPYDWGPIGLPGDGQYAGPSAASEPETQAIVQLITELRPDLVIWYHQDLNRIAPGTGRDGAIRARYAELVGLPVVSITGGTYTGVAATWARHTIEPGVAFIVELGVSLNVDEARMHADAVLTVAGEEN
jgi:protein MpaA